MVVLRNASASSSGVMVPPFSLTSFASTMPSDGFARIAGRAGFAVAVVSVSVESSTLATVTPSSRNDGLPWIPWTRW